MIAPMHTPGPWLVGGEMTGPTTPAVLGPTVAGTRWPHMPVTKDMATVAIVPACTGQQADDEPHDVPQMIANARLIAAAPELLVALEALAGGTCEALALLDSETVNRLAPPIAAARAAIAKARGAA